MTQSPLRALLASGLLLTACGQDDKPAPAAAPSKGPATSVGTPASSGDPLKGRQVWLAQCVACHHSDPSKDGPVGPAVKGASAELVDGKVLRGVYPPGYAPKRPSKIMPARPDLAASVPDLAAYLR